MKALGLITIASGFLSDVESSAGTLWLSFGMMVSSLVISSAVRKQIPRWVQLFTINIHYSVILELVRPASFFCNPSSRSYSVFDTTHVSSSRFVRRDFLHHAENTLSCPSSSPTFLCIKTVTFELLQHHVNFSPRLP